MNTTASDQKSPREIQLEAFLGASGFEGAQRRKLAGDASFRSYQRLSRGDKTYVLMDAPPPKEDVRPFIAIDKHLVLHGFSAPRILAEDVKHGFLILEDLGNSSFTNMLARNREKEWDLYALAVEVLGSLHTKPLPENIKPYDKEKLLKEAMLLPEWYYQLMHGKPIPEKAMKEYRSLWEGLLPAVETAEPVLVLRDYHADNLMWLPSRTSIAKVGLLDFQDAVSGHPAYDLVSLLEDARRDVPPEVAEEMIRLYLRMMPGTAADAFRTAYALLGAQRNCKILGIFARLWLRDKKVNYLTYLPRVWHHLEHDLTHSKLAGVKAWLDNCFPALDRRNVPVIGSE
jgi:aminoglycoside/choline kinase family phosphotransferase